MLQVALVAEAACIGCTACFQVCPTGALVGAAKQVHAVLADRCTGCGACVPACPVPCITLEPWAGTSHPLQGANTAAGAALAAAYQQQQAQRGARAQATVVAKPTVAAPELPPELAALAAAARQKSAEKYQKMGPLRRPRALPRSRG